MLPDQAVVAAAAQATSTTAPMPPMIPTEFQKATDTGFGTLWVVFIIMTLASGLFTILSWNVPVSRRLYHVVTSLITITAAISYYGMATGHAVSLHCVSVKNNGGSGGGDYMARPHAAAQEVCREVYWARYVDWSLTTPLLLLDLCLLAGIDGAHTLMAIFADVVMVLTGLFAAYGNNDVPTQKWGWYFIACFAYAIVIWHVGTHGSSMVRAKGQKTVQLFGSLAVFTFILWTAYPIVWAIADGSRKATVDTEILAYAVLDTLAKPIFGIWLLLSHRAMPETNVELGGWWSNGLGAEGRIRIGDDDGH